MIYKALLILSVSVLSSASVLTTPPSGPTRTTTFATNTNSCWASTIISQPTGGVPTWSQCGGLGYTGSSSCGSYAECTYVNEYYSYCTPKPVTRTVSVCS